jgi:hypothetical protein
MLAPVVLEGFIMAIVVGHADRAMLAEEAGGSDRPISTCGIIGGNTLFPW